MKDKKPTLIPQGADKKVLIQLSNLPDGATMDSIDFEVTFTSGHRSVTLPKSQLKKIDGNYYFPLATKDLGIGDLMLYVNVAVPDDDFDDGVRNEPLVYDMNAKIIKPW